MARVEMSDGFVRDTDCMGQLVDMGFVFSGGRRDGLRGVWVYEVSGPGVPVVDGLVEIVLESDADGRLSVQRIEPVGVHPFIRSTPQL